MKPKSKFLTTYYFRRFALVNGLIFGSLLLTRLIIVQNIHIFIVYITMLIGLAAYARINFELLRPYAGVGMTLLLFWMLRIVLIFCVRSDIGVLASITPEMSAEYLAILTNSYLIEVVNLFGGLGIFFLIFDMYLAVKFTNKIDQSAAKV